MQSGRVFSLTLCLTVLFLSLPQLIAQVAFDRSDFNVGPAPVSIVVGDFNRDGALDLAVAELRRS